MILYHYVHCPFCIRVRMAFSFLNISYLSKVTPYDDELTPKNLTGVKMLPIVTLDNGKSMNESLEIIKLIDQKNDLHFEHYEKLKNEIESLLELFGKDVHSLCMPYWIYTPEFTESSRQYFQKKKEIKKGPFKNLILEKDKYISSLNKNIEQFLVPNLNPFYKSEILTVVDIMIAAHLWGMFIFPEFQFNEKIYQYLMKVKHLTKFNYHEDFFR